MQNLIKEIKEAEEKALRIEKEAALQAQEEIKNIKEKHRKAIEELKMKFSSLKKESIKRAKDDFKNEKITLDEKARNRITQIIEKAAENKEAAEEFILKKILE